MTFSEKNVCKNCGQPNAVPELEQKNNEIGLKLMKMVWDGWYGHGPTIEQIQQIEKEVKEWLKT